MKTKFSFTDNYFTLQLNLKHRKYWPHIPPCLLHLALSFQVWLEQPSLCYGTLRKAIKKSWNITGNSQRILSLQRQEPQTVWATALCKPIWKCHGKCAFYDAWYNQQERAYFWSMCDGGLCYLKDYFFYFTKLPHGSVLLLILNFR